jgi:hypothetical protein
MRNVFVTVFLTLICVAGINCAPNGYASPSRLNMNGQGPDPCAERCTSMGMKMGAVVLARSESVCVCVPGTTSPNGTGSSASIQPPLNQATGLAAAHFLLDGQKKEADKEKKEKEEREKREREENERRLRQKAMGM